MKLSLLAVLLAAVPVAAQSDRDSNDRQGNEGRIRESANVLREIMNAGDQSIPRDILASAQCVGIVPNMKRAGFIVGGQYGKGVLTCRTDDARWSSPAMIRIEGGSVGFQIGAGETDVVFVVRNREGEHKLLQDKFTFGADAGVMAGPVGRTAQAQTDAQMHAEILGYSRSRGVFAGVALNGSTLRPDTDANRALYGRDATMPQILHGDIQAPAAARDLADELNRITGHAGGD